MTETEVLFTRLFGCDRGELHLSGKRRLTGAQSRFVASCLRRRITGEPLEYILGSCEFMGMEFAVDRRCLIPRPETELLVETAMRHATLIASPKIADFCTGSGNIAVSLASFLPSCRVSALDVSEGALELAKTNAARHRCGDRVSFVQADLRRGTGLPEKSFDMIVSNPPYVVSSEIDRLQPEVRSEPRLALDGGEDGLLFYRIICAEARRLLKPGGLLLMEMGAGQRHDIEEILGKEGGLSVREVVRDYNGIERVIVVQERVYCHGQTSDRGRGKA